jgi:hypothetical protein
MPYSRDVSGRIPGWMREIEMLELQTIAGRFAPGVVVEIGSLFGRSSACWAECLPTSWLERCEDWVNELFLSCRFLAERDGPYNEYLYSFFKCLTPERLKYAERYYEEQDREDETFDCGGYRIQRRCPHQRADLTRFGKVENGILTCHMHGWQFDLASGKCLTADGLHIRVDVLDKSTRRMPSGTSVSTTLHGSSRQQRRS